MKTTLGTESQTDEQLVEWSLTGDREAFGRIVERYQSLVCSITYGATGSLGASEDLAQETFLTAWRNLTGLREANKLRAWLCGIARNLTNNFQRRREPMRGAESLDEIGELPAIEPSPSAHAVSREEEAILWRALERIPETYREPLILFYREHRSVERVAEELELREDAVKQRLSRGRKLLADEVAAFVEGTLERTTPGRAFTLDVLAGLPLTALSTGAAGAGVAAKGTAVSKSVGFFPAFIPTIAAMAAGWLVVRAAPTPRERRLKAVSFILLWAFILGWLHAALPAVRVLSEHFQWSDRARMIVMAGFWWLYVSVPTGLTVVMIRRMLAIREQTAATSGPPASSPKRRIWRTVILHLAGFGWMIGWAVQSGDRFSAAIIAAVMVFLGVLNVYQGTGKTGVSVMRATARHLALVLSAILVVVNWRLDVWLAADRGITFAEMHRLLPMWVVHVLTLAFVLWVVMLLVITRPKRSAQRGLSSFSPAEARA